jgi:hypothetical protein
MRSFTATAGEPERPLPLITIHGLDEIPTFANECEEHEFWKTPEFSDEFMEQATWDPADPFAPDQSPRLPDDVDN